MAIRPLVILPDAQLRLVSKPVEAVTPEIRTLVADMFETMYDAPGIGLAAIQIGVPLRIVTIDLSKPASESQGEAGAAEGEPARAEGEPRNPMVFINPEVVWASEEHSVYEEGCLSIPEYYEEVERPASVKVRYMDLDGNAQEIAAEGLLATCLQHEIDHLDGILFIDHLSRLKRERVTKRFAKAARRESAA